MRINERKAGAILTYVQIILSNTISLLYTPLALRMLGQSQYGLFGAASSVTSYLGLLGFGIGGAYIRWNAKYRAKNDIEGERRLNGMFFTIFSIISAATLIIGIILTLLAPLVFSKSFTSKEISDLEVIVFINVLSSAMGMFFTPIMNCIQAYEKFFVYRILAIVNILITPIVNILILLSGGKAIALSLATLVFSTINYLVYFIYARKRLNMKFIFKGFKFREFKEIILFSSFIFLNSITDLITNSTDSVLIGSLIGASAIAVYSVGRNFQNYFLHFSTSVSGVFAPQVNQIVASGKDDSVLDELFIRVGRVQFYVVTLILIGFATVGQQFVCFWAGQEYEDSYWIGLLLLSASYVPLFQNVGLEIQKAKNKHKFRSVVFFFVAIVNVVLTIPFTYWWGAIGATFATFLCVVLGQVVVINVYNHKVIGLDMIKFWKNICSIFPSLIPTLVVCFIIKFVLPVESLVMVLVSALVITAVYIVSVWLFSMNDYEKELILKPVKKILKISK